MPDETAPDVTHYRGAGGPTLRAVRRAAAMIGGRRHRFPATHRVHAETGARIFGPCLDCGQAWPGPRSWDDRRAERCGGEP